jgi:hypothetical protein
MVKRIKLFGLVIWEIETIEDEPEDEEPMSDPYTLGVTIHLAGDTPPTFGFVTEYYDE